MEPEERPNIQIDDLVRPMTDDEYVKYLTDIQASAIKILTARITEVPE